MLIRILIALTLLTAPAAADHASSAARHFDSGQRLFAQGRLRDAVGEFKRAYELDPQPRYLYNAAQSMRLAGDCGAAVSLYQAFLRVAPDEDARNAATRNLQRCSPPPAPAEAAADPEPPTVEEAPPPVEAPAPVAKEPEPPPAAPELGAVAPPPAQAKAPTTRLRWIGGAGGTIAGAALLSAAILEGQGAARFAELSRTCAPSCSPAQALSLQRLLDAATGLFVAGGLVAAATVVAVVIVRARSR
jgi:tetratricopeptide (TPR) repeat protein